MLGGLEDFCARTRAALQSPQGLVQTLEAISKDLAALCLRPDFMESVFDEQTPFGHRELYRDATTDFRVLAHVQQPGKRGKPHDHGASWAVYATVKGFTRMTDWRRVNSDPERAVLEPIQTYDLEAGEAAFFGPHVLHSTEHPAKTWVIRVTGTDLDAIPRYHFRARSDQMIERA